MSLASKFNLQRWNFTIRTKLAVLITLLIAGISLFIFVYFPFRLENQAVKGIVHEAESITEMTAFHVGPGLFFEDLEAIEEAFKGAQKNRDLIYMVVMNNSGQVFAAFNRKEANRSNFAQTTDNQHISQDGMIYRTTTPILNNGEKIGQFYLGLSFC